MNDTLTDLVLKLSDTGWKAVKAFANFFIFLFNTSMNDFIDIIMKVELLGPFFGWIYEKNLEGVLNALGIGEMSVLMFIAVDGLIVIAVLQFIKWILGFVF